MAKRDRAFSFKKEDQQVEAKLEELEKEFYRHEQHMRKAASEYEHLITRTSSILSSIAALRKFRNEKRRNSSGN